MSSLKLNKIILPVLFLVFIVPNSYAQLNKSSDVKTTSKAQILLDEGTQYYTRGEIDLALEKFQLGRKASESSRDMCTALAIDTWLVKIHIFLGEYQLGISLLNNTKSQLKQNNCSTAILGFKDLDLALDSIDYHANGMKNLSQNNPNEALRLLEKAKEIYHELGETALEGLVIYEIGEVYRNIEEWNKALSYFNQVLQLSESLDHLAGKMTALGNIGYCHAKIGQHDKAKSFIEDSWTAAKKMDKGPFNCFLFGSLADLMGEMAHNHATRGESDETFLYYDYALRFISITDNFEIKRLGLDVIEAIATFYFNKGEPHKAIDIFNRWLSIAQELGEEIKQGDFYHGLAVVNFMIGNYHKTIDYAMKAVVIYRDLGELEKESLALARLAGAYMRLSQFENSVTYANEALECYTEIENFDGAMHTLLDLAYINWEFGNNHIASHFLEKAYKILSYVKYQATKKRFLFITGLVLEKMGSYETALNLLLDNLQWAQSSEIKSMTSIYALIEIYGAIALTYFDMGDQDHAGIYGEKVQALTAKSGYLWAEAFFLNYYSLVPLETKNYSEALAVLTKARKIFKEMGNVRGEIDNLLFTNHVLCEQLSKTKKDVSEKDYENINNYLIEALNLSKDIGDKGNEAAALTMLGINYINAGKYAKAEKFLKDAKTIAENNIIPELVITTNHYLGKVYEGKKQYMDALSYYEEAIKTIETLRRGFSLSILKGKFLEKRRDVYDSYFNLLLKLYKLNPTKNYKSRAFTIVEKAKARCLLDSLRRVNCLEIEAKKENLLSKETEKGIKELQEKLEKGEHATEQGTYVKTDLAILRDELKLSKASVEELIQSQASSTKPLIPDIQYTEIQSLLEQNAIFVEYVFSEGKVYVWLIKKDKFEICELSINAHLLENMVRDYRAILTKPRLSARQLSNHIRLGQELFKILLSPVENEILAGNKLIVVPDGPLYSLPFETLIIPPPKPEAGQKDTRGIPYLITKTPIAYFHSGAVMVSMMKKSESSTKTEKGQYDIVAFGDPVYSSTEKSKETEVDKRGFFETRGINFERLTYSSDEVKNIAKIFDLEPSSECINLRERANEKRVHDLVLKNYRRIHFATHGILADEITWINQPALVLSLLGTDEKYDGFFSMDEIYDMDLNADLVVLSACKTGLGEEIRGEGLVGLTHAFIHAGTNSVVVSLWDVNDRSTSMLMERFYQYLKTLNKSEALRQAKLDLMQGKSTASKERGVGGIIEGDADVNQNYSHPYFWAPFILIGKYD